MRSAISTEHLTAQVKGSAKIMVTVVATQDLKPGDVLRRFKEETAQDEPRRGNNIVASRSISGNNIVASRSSSGLLAVTT